jgi:glycine dehydrogenase subunit 1
MPYYPHTEAERAEMLAAVGATKIDELFADVPERFRFPKLDLPDALSELEVLQDMRGLADDNAHSQKQALFLGAGAYQRFTPSVVNYMIQRGEFLTAYTPYQPEVSQGTLQVIYEWQSMVCALTGLDVANASHYDGATSLAEAVIMAFHHHREKRKKVVISPAVHPHYRQVVRTYTQGMGITVVGDDAANDLDDLVKRLDGDTLILIVQSPNFFGQIESLDGLAQKAHAVGALLCVAVDPVSLGLLKPPGAYGADIAVGEGQSLGLPLSFGGPYVGFFATRKEYVRKMAGRLVGEAKDKNGQRGFVLTLSTREQHIKREKATSNICTNQGLMAVAATVYLATLGKQGLRRVAELCWHKSHYAAQQIGQIPGYRVDTRKPFFQEFVVQCPRPVNEINAHLLAKHNLIGGYDLGQDYAHLANHMLVAVTEMNTRAQIDTLVTALKELG